MNRRWFLVLGILIFVSNVAVLAAFGFPAVSGSPTVAATVAIALGGLLFMLGGLDRQFQRVGWYQFVGGADIIMGVAMISFLVPIVNSPTLDKSGGQIIFAICAAVGGVSLIYIGVDWIRGGHHFDLSSYELRSIIIMDR